MKRIVRNPFLYIIFYPLLFLNNIFSQNPWIEFQIPCGSFYSIKISFPGNPKSTDNYSSGNPCYYYQTTNSTFMASVEPFSKYENLQKNLLIKEFIKGFAASVISEKEEYINGFRNIEAYYALPNKVGYGSIRFVFVNERLIILVYFSMNYAKEEFSKFSNSLKIWSLRK